MAIKKKGLFIIIAAVLIIAVVVVLGGREINSSKSYTVRPKNFELTISAKGEIQGKNAVLITLPDEFKKREMGIYEIQIKDILQEGSKVKKGEWVATLDASAINRKIQENKDNLEKHFAELNDAKIDSAIQLTKLREEISEFKYDLEYKELELEQAKFESPAFQRKTQVAFNKTLRQMDKKRRDYELKKLDLKMRLRRKERDYNRYYTRDSLLKKALSATRVLAPQDGMIMYARLWGGRKIKVGDNVSMWNPTIATLPDMSQPVSETYIKEIDINKLQLGDSVSVTIDALPDKIFAGKISKIANIGQEISGFDSKVFQVLIDLDQHINKLKPAMTTNNNIVVKNEQSVITIPREYLFGGNGDSFVYLKKSGKITAHKVKPGLENDDDIIITSGLKENDKIFLAGQ